MAYGMGVPTVKLLRVTLLRLSGLVGTHRSERELHDELDAHLDLHIEDNLRAGMPPHEARRRALMRLGGVETVSAECRDQRGVPALESTLQDARYALRTLRKAPGFTVTTILTMALGIGATTTLFGITYGVLLRPLPWTDPERLVQVTEARGGNAGRVPGTISNSAYLAWIDQPSTIEGLGGWRRGQAVTLGDGGDPLRIQLTRVTPTLFTVLKAQPQLGRMLVADDGIAGGPVARTEAIILSYGLWQERFGGRDDVIGRAIRVDGQPATVVGVMPRTFAFPDRETRAWATFAVPQVHVGAAINGAIFPVLARLKPGVTTAQAAAEGTARARGAPDMGMTAVALFGSNQPASVSVASALAAMTAGVRPAILLLLVGAGLLLLTATANVASLQLARAVARRREIAIRRAVGAGTGRIARQLIVENVIVGSIGGVTGLALALALYRVAPAILPADFPRLGTLALDWHAALFAATATLCASTLCGILSAYHVQRDHLIGSLAQGGRPHAADSVLPTVHLRTLIMMGQVAVVCILLVGAGLLARSFLALLHADRGYDAANVLTARVPFPPRYPNARRIQILQGLLERVRALPGVNVAAYGNALPYVSSGGFRGQKMRPPREPGAEIDMSWTQHIVSPGYFEALRLRVVAGRSLTDADTATSPSVVVVNRSFARKYLTDPAIGNRLPLSLRQDRREVEVVGVVDDMRQGDMTDPTQPEIFAPYRQVTDAMSAQDSVLVIRTTREPGSYASPVRDLLRDQDASLPLDSVMTMEDRVEGSLARPRTYAVLLAGFAAGALAIASVGLFGLLTYSVAQRTKEIGVRMALGALTGHIVTLVLGQALVIVGAGLAVGLAASLALGAVLRSFLYGVSAHDGLTMIAVAAVLAIASVAACVIPARRATRLSPLIALRAE
jgi:predicted permease